MLFGRDRELAELIRGLEEARDGRGSAVVVSGPPGIGKTALLDGLAANAEGARVLRATGIESEAGLPFAALHLLVAPMLDRIGALPEPQADALRAAFGLARPGDDDVRFLVGLGLLTLLGELADEEVVLCVVDDAQWVDGPSLAALAFAARRLAAERVAVVFGVRDDVPAALAGLPVIVPSPLDATQASAVVAAHVPDLNVAARDRVVAESAGNPLALRELAVGLRDQGHAASDPAAALPAPEAVAATFRRRLAELPDRVGRLVVVAAADRSGSVDTLVSAAGSLGGTLPDLDAAVAAGVLVVHGDSYTFRHPLIRSTAYQDASVTDRVNAHRALADALAPDVPGGDHMGGERELTATWHRALAATGPDAVVSREMEQAADHAWARGGGSVDAYAQAARLHPEPAQRARLLVRAAQTAIVAGETERAAELSSQATALTDDPTIRGALAMIDGTAEKFRGRPREAARILVAGAEPLAGTAGLAPTLVTIAAGYAWFAGDAVALRAAADLARHGRAKAPVESHSDLPTPTITRRRGSDETPRDPGHDLSPSAVMAQRGNSAAPGEPQGDLPTSGHTAQRGSAEAPGNPQGDLPTSAAAIARRSGAAPGELHGELPTSAAVLLGGSGGAAGDLAASAVAALAALAGGGGGFGVVGATSDVLGGALGALGGFVARERVAPSDMLITRMFAAYCARILGDDAAGVELGEAEAARCRARGTVGALPDVLAGLAYARLAEGRYHDAEASAAEALAFAREARQTHVLPELGDVALRIAAIRGAEERCRELVAEYPGELGGNPALGLLDLGLGRYEAAVTGLDAAVNGAGAYRTSLLFAVPDLVEAAVRAGHPEQAERPLGRFLAWADASPVAWTQAVALRCRAMLAEGTYAEELFGAAIDHHAGTGRPFEFGRTELLYGEWLRRERRRVDARRVLRSAEARFARLGADPWVRRARTELRATGESTTVPAAPVSAPAAPDAPDLLGLLTPQELQVVRLAAGGASNQEIATQLFLSRRTVEYHLYKAYPKLGIGSRRELLRIGLA